MGVTFFIEYTHRTLGQIVEIQNLSQDLGIAQNTVREYLGLLEKTYLVSQVFNLGIGFRTRSTRQRKSMHLR